MVFYRLIRARYLATPLDGEGARIYGARWNPPGHRVVYLADHPATAIVETLVHLANPALAPTDYHLLTVEVPESLVASAHTIDASALPADWRDVNNAECQETGLRWLSAVSHTVVCRVPSAAVPGAHNLLVDPGHRDAELIRVVHRERFQFDPRLV